MITIKTKSGKGGKRSTSKHVVFRVPSESVTDPGDDRTKPLEKPHERLGPWLELANLLPSAPPRDELRFLDPEPLDRWRAHCRAVPWAEFVHRFERSRLAHALGITDTLDLELLRDDHDHASRFLELAGVIASSLQTLVAAASPEILKAADKVPLRIRQTYENPAVSRSEIWIFEGTVTTQWADPFKDFLAALDGVEAVRVRQCPVCSHFFFAIRKDQKACSKRCNAARRVRDWRMNQARHEYQRKLRGAGLLAAKKTKLRKK